MKAYDVKKMSYRDKLARRNRRLFVFKLAGFAAGAIVIAGGGIYLLFFSGKLVISDITITGLKTLSQDTVMASLGEQMDRRKMGYLKTQQNIIFFDADGFEQKFKENYPVLKTIDARKDLPNKLTIEVSEREPAGTWCSAGECRYFDGESATWGSGVRSSGFLFLTIEDRRPREVFAIDGSFFTVINEVVKNIPSSVTIRNIIIPEDSFDEFHVYTGKGFYLIFSLDSDVKNQLEVLRIFLADRTKDISFNPQYLDLRIDGRVYLK